MARPDHAFFTRPFVSESSGCFHVLATVDIAAVSTEGACVFLNCGFLRGHAIKGKETGSFAEIWMDLGPVMLSEVSPKQKNTCHLLTHICEF